MGKTIFFLSVEEFKTHCRRCFCRIQKKFIKINSGTLKSEVEGIWQEGKVVIFDVDVKVA